MVQDELPAILLTRVQQVYAILVSVADGPKVSASNGEENHAETEAEILVRHEAIANEKELISSTGIKE